MKTKIVVAVLTAVSSLVFVTKSQAQTSTAVTNGDWSNPLTWGGTVPATNASVNIESPYTVTVDTNEMAFNVAGTGTLVMNPAVSLTITANGPLGGFTGTFNATAVSNTVVLTGDTFASIGSSATVPHTFYNLTLAPVGGGGVFSQVPMTVAGTLTMTGGTYDFVNPGQGDGPWTIGNLVINSNAQFNCGGSAVTVTNSTIINGGGLPPGLNQGYGVYPGGLIDNEGQTQALDDQFGSITVTTNGIWYMGDVVEWALSGSLTNFGIITNTGDARLTFVGNGTIAGNPFGVPALSFYGTNTILTTITNSYYDFFTNNASLTFDIGQFGAIIDPLFNLTYPTNGTLNLIDSGAPPLASTPFQLFDNSAYFGYFGATNSTFGYTATLNLNGSIIFTGVAPPANPKITAVSYNRATEQYTLTWTSSPTATYSVQETTSLNNGAVSWNTVAGPGIVSGGATTTKTVTVPGGKTGFLRVSSP